MHKSFTPIFRESGREGASPICEYRKNLPKPEPKSANNSFIADSSAPQLANGIQVIKVRLGAQRTPPGSSSPTLTAFDSKAPRPKSGIRKLYARIDGQSTDSLKALSPIGNPIKQHAEESKALQLISKKLLTITNERVNSPVKSGTAKQYTVQEAFYKLGSVTTFLGEGCASFLSQPSLISKLTQHPRIAPTKLVSKFKLSADRAS